MKKLRLDTLRVDSFATTADIDAVRGTVAAYSARCTLIDCPISYGGTCYVTCWDSCYCDTNVC
jgi:hypothetical protein